MHLSTDEMAFRFVNSEGVEITPAFFKDETGAVVMYFGRYVPGTPGQDIYQSRMIENDKGKRQSRKGKRIPTFGPAIPVTELNTADYGDLGPAVRRDGLEIIFVTRRPGGLGMMDLWTATRKSTFHPWSEPVPVDILNSEFHETGRISLSHDGRELYFRSDRPGLGEYGDLYVAKRDKLRGKKKTRGQK